MKEKDSADKTGVERFLERWKGEGGEVLPTALRFIELTAIEKQENMDDGQQHTGEEKVIENIVKRPKMFDSSHGIKLFFAVAFIAAFVVMTATGCGVQTTAMQGTALEAGYSRGV